MTSSTRTGRRRRLLHEGASDVATSVSASNGPEGPRVRFTPPPQSASFALAGRVLPQTRAQLTAATLGLVGVSSLVAWSAAPSTDGSVFATDKPGSLAAWWESALWLAVAAQCVLVFGMRRHRTDDLSGAYRGWLFAATFAAVLSLTSSTQAHQEVASRLAASTGFTPAAIWWMGPSLLATASTAAWVGVEVRECPLALGLTTAGVACAALSVTATLGGVPESVTAATPWLTPTMIGTLAACLTAALVLVGLVAYSRRIVRETRGEVSPPVVAKLAVETTEATPRALEVGEETKEERPSAPARPRRAKVTRDLDDEEELYEFQESIPAKNGAARKPKREAARPRLAEETAAPKWVSGVEGVEEDYDDEAPGPRKRTKAERKQLRREKGRENDRRAA